MFGSSTTQLQFHVGVSFYPPFDAGVIYLLTALIVVQQRSVQSIFGVMKIPDSASRERPVQTLQPSTIG